MTERIYYLRTKKILLKFTTMFWIYIGQSRSSPLPFWDFFKQNLLSCLALRYYRSKSFCQVDFFCCGAIKWPGDAPNGQFLVEIICNENKVARKSETRWDWGMEVAESAIFLFKATLPGVKITVTSILLVELVSKHFHFGKIQLCECVWRTKFKETQSFWNVEKCRPRKK